MGTICFTSKEKQIVPIPSVGRSLSPVRFPPTTSSGMPFCEADVKKQLAAQIWESRLESCRDAVLSVLSEVTTDLNWMLVCPNAKRIFEVTLVRNKECLRLFRSDAGAMRVWPPRSDRSIFWDVYNPWFVDAMNEKRLHGLVTSFYGKKALEGLELGGVQLAWSPPNTVRGLHKDKPDIAALLVTFTLIGNGNIHIVGDNGDSIEFEQGVNEAYLLAGSALNEARHSAKSGIRGRGAVTFRFVQRRESLA